MSIARKILMGSSGGKKSIYVDDVFSTYLYIGNNTDRTIVNGIDLSGEGGLVWIKNRTAAWRNRLNDTVRGAGKELKSDTNQAENNATTSLTQFNNNGFDLGIHSDVNRSNDDFVSWTFRKTPGFFDVVSYTGNASAWNSGSQVLNHSLGCVPGLIIIKSRNQGAGPPDRDFYVYHKDIPNKPLYLNLNNAHGTGAGAPNYDPRYFNDPVNNPPTASTFQVGDNVSGGGSYGGPPGFGANENGQEYIAYLFANGGEAGSYGGTASGTVTAYVKGDSTMTSSGVSMTTGPFGASNTAVNFSNNLNALEQPATWQTGTSNYTIECWFKAGSTAWSQNWSMLISRWVSNSSIYLGLRPSGQMHFINYNQSSGDVNVGWTQNTWHHVAIVREGTGSNETHMYLDGVKKHSWTDNTNVADSTSPVGFGWNNQPYNGENLTGQISNARITIGQALYTANFTPATSNLTTTSQGAIASNVKFLGLNGNAMTLSDESTSDPLASIFGEKGDQNIVKCGSYVGNGSNDGPEIYLGWEPQYLLFKNANTGNENWRIYDSMRGWSTGGLHDGEDLTLLPNESIAEVTNQNFSSITSTGFKVVSNDAALNNSGKRIIYIAIRRPDPLVAKPIELASEVFHMLPSPPAPPTGYPWYRPTEFPVDFSLSRQVTGTHNWDMGARIMQGRKLQCDNNSAGSSGTYNYYDFQNGWNPYTGSLAGHQAWMWKRHAGFDVVTYNIPTSSGQKSIKHNLGREPEMIWLKYRDGSDDWLVYNKYLGGGTDPWDYFLRVNTNDAQSNTYPNYWGTSSSDMNANYFTINQQFRYTGNHVMMLFASVDGISKVGSYAGSSSTVTVTTGFQPRFVIIKNITSSAAWLVLDTSRGWTGTNDKYIFLSSASPQSSDNYGAPTATGFTVTSSDSSANGTGRNFIYYAHA